MHSLSSATLLLTASAITMFVQAQPDLSFLNDPMFPGNPGWQQQLQNSMPKFNNRESVGSPAWRKKATAFTRDPMYPGNPEWMKKATNFRKHPNFPGNPAWYKKKHSFFDDPMFPGNPEWMKKHANPIIPKFPKNFPFPPSCNKTSDPGFSYPSLNQVTINNSPVRSNIQYTAYICSDPRYQQNFYLLETKAETNFNGSSNKQSSVKYYTLQGVEMNYQPEVQYQKAIPD